MFPQADSEFDRCLNRRGEALALFLDEEPTYGFFPNVYYYQGRVREGLKSTSFADSYRAYLDIRGASTDDPLVAEARRRASQVADTTYLLLHQVHPEDGTGLVARRGRHDRDVIRADRICLPVHVLRLQVELPGLRAACTGTNCCPDRCS